MDEYAGYGDISPYHAALYKQQRELLEKVANLTEQIASAEALEQKLRDERAIVFSNLRALDEPVKYTDISDYCGLSPSFIHAESTRGMKLKKPKRRLGGILQEQLDLYNAKLAKEAEKS